jgi:hypothetical protein
MRVKPEGEYGYVWASSGNLLPQAAAAAAAAAATLDKQIDPGRDGPVQVVGAAFEDTTGVPQLFLVAAVVGQRTDIVGIEVVAAGED